MAPQNVTRCKIPPVSYSYLDSWTLERMQGRPLLLPLQKNHRILLSHMSCCFMRVPSACTPRGRLACSTRVSHAVHFNLRHAVVLQCLYTIASVRFRHSITCHPLSEHSRARCAESHPRCSRRPSTPAPIRAVGSSLSGGACSQCNL